MSRTFLRLLPCLLPLMFSAGCDGDESVDCRFFNDCDGNDPSVQGELSIYLAPPNAGSALIYVDGEPKGTLNTYSYSPVTCNHPSALTLSLPAGPHQVYGTTGTYTSPVYTVQVPADNCVVHAVQF